MTAPETPVGACGDAAPTGDHPDSPQSRALLNAVSRARGALAVEADTAKRHAERISAAAELLLAALDGGDYWETDLAIKQLVATLNDFKDKP